MKSIVFALLIAAVAATPLFRSKEEDWQLVPDHVGHMHLVDINAVDMDAEPLFVPNTDVIFHLFTRQNPTTPQNIILHNEGQLTGSNFVASRQSRFHCHGWGAAGPNAGALIRNAFLQTIDANVFIVNWSAGSDTPNYITARQRVPLVAAVITNFCRWINARGTPFNNIVSIGHSLGAHIAGIAGKPLRASGTPLQAVVALCAAGPLFSLDDPAGRVAHDDATYTEMILTNSGGLGTIHPYCQHNFFVNGGSNQPGCGTEVGCSHGLAINAYADTITNERHFVGQRCENQQALPNCAGPTARMGGEPVNNSARSPDLSVFMVHRV